MPITCHCTRQAPNGGGAGDYQSHILIKQKLISICLLLQVPIIAPVKHKKVEVLEKEALRTNYTNEFLTGLLNSNADVTRNIAVIGHLHHGKTTVCPLNLTPARVALVAAVHRCPHFGGAPAASAGGR